MRDVLGGLWLAGLVFGCAAEAGGGIAGGDEPGVAGTAASVGGATHGSGGAAPFGGGAPGSGGGPTGVGGAGEAGAGGAAGVVGGAGGVDPGPKQPLAPAPGKWIAVKKGSYLAGAPKGEACNGSVNQLEHAVTLTHDFEMSATEVTFAEYQAALGAPHSMASSCSDCPANLMTWHRAAEVCNAYSKLAGLTPCYACSGSGEKGSCSEMLSPYECHGYRLPTEAEWEYAYRAGTSSPIYNGDIAVCGGLDPTLDQIAWFLYNASGGAHPVGIKQANAWGFFDMSGNVWEWTHDGYVTDRSTLPKTDPIGASSDGLRVMRGGSYNCVPEEVRAAHRSGLPAAIAGGNVGVRCARTLD